MHKRYNIIAVIITFLGVAFLPVQGQDSFFYDVGQPTPNNPATTDLAWQAGEFIDDDTGIFVRIMKLFGVYSFTNNGSESGTAVAYIQYIINMLLWVAAFIALIILIYGFYLMFFSKQEEWFEKAKKIIIWVTVALFIMWLSWVIVSFLFYLYNLIQ
jgi:drug/metabolite transporter (DMT)-like permease